MSDVLRVQVVDLTEDGEGIAFGPNGIKIFIKGGYPGDDVEVTLYGIKEKYAQGKLMRIVSSKIPRIQPFCQNQCGSCSYTDLEYRTETALKESKLLELYANTMGKNYDESLYKGFIGMEFPFEYRNKAVYAVEKSGDEYKVGLYRRQSHAIIDIRCCRLEPEWINAARNGIRDTLNSAEFRNLTASSERTLRYLFLRGSDKGEKIAVLVVYFKFPGIELLTEKLNSLGIKNVLLSVNHEEGNRILGDTMVVLSGENTITVDLLNLKFKVNPYSFLQINTEQTAKLYRTAVDQLGLEQDDSVLDLYCGIGTISLYMAGMCHKVFGVECVSEAIDNAVENALANGISNTDFRVGLVEKILPQIIAEGHKVTKAVLDPARKGCAPEVFKTLSGAGINTIAYVSCNPKSQCRDILIAMQYGYKVKSIRAVDMFPHTYHVETVVLLSRDKA